MRIAWGTLSVDRASPIAVELVAGALSGRRATSWNDNARSSRNSSLRSWSSTSYATAAERTPSPRRRSAVIQPVDDHRHHRRQAEGTCGARRRSMGIGITLLLGARIRKRTMRPRTPRRRCASAMTCRPAAPRPRPRRQPLADAARPARPRARRSRAPSRPARRKQPQVMRIAQHCAQVVDPCGGGGRAWRDQVGPRSAP